MFLVNWGARPLATPPRRTMGPGGLVIHRQVGPTGVRRAGSQVDPSSRRFPLWVDLAYREQAPFPPPVVTKPLGPMGLTRGNTHTKHSVARRGGVHGVLSWAASACSEPEAPTPRTSRT